MFLYFSLFYFNPFYSYGYHSHGCLVCFFPLHVDVCGGCGCVPVCGGCSNLDLNCNGSGSDNGAPVLLIILAIAVVIVMLIGAIVGIIFLIQIGTVILTRRMKILRKKHEVIDYEVVDIQGNGMHQPQQPLNDSQTVPLNQY